MRKDGGGDQISANISGDVHGQVAVGKDNVQTQAIGDEAVAALTSAELAELRRAFQDLRAQVAAAAPDDKMDAALSRVDELEEAVVGEKPDPTTIELVRRWFVQHLPAVAGAVTGVLAGPLVGQAVAAAGQALLPAGD